MKTLKHLLGNNIYNILFPPYAKHIDRDWHDLTFKALKRSGVTASGSRALLDIYREGVIRAFLRKCLLRSIRYFMLFVGFFFPLTAYLQKDVYSWGTGQITFICFFGLVGFLVWWLIGYSERFYHVKLPSEQRRHYRGKADYINSDPQ